MGSSTSITGGRVVITGIGAVASLGATWAEIARRLETGARALALAGAALPQGEDCVVGLVREIRGFEAAFPEIRPPLPVRLSQILLLSARDCIEDAGLAVDRPRGDVGVMMNRDRGPTSVVSALMERVDRLGPRAMRPLLFSQSVANAPIGLVATHLNLRGPHVLTMGGGCFPLARACICRGEASAVLCGGFEEVEVHSLVTGEALGYFQPRHPPEAYRPHDAESAGTTLSEGGVCLLLERPDAARERGARVHAGLLSVVTGVDAEADLTEEAVRGWGSLSGAALSSWCAEALGRAGVEARDIGLLVSGANGLPAYDAAERDAQVRLGLGHLTPRAPKAQLGEGLGMSFAASIAWAADALRRGVDGAGRALVTNIGFHGEYSAAVLEAP